MDNHHVQILTMLTHTIKLSPDYTTPSQHSNVLQLGGPRSQHGRGLESQEELDDYLKRAPEWLKAGNFICYEHNKNLTGVHSIHYIAKVITKFEELPLGVSYEDLPRVMRVVNVNFTKNMEKNEVCPTWDRMDNIRGYRQLTEEEMTHWVNKNDYLQDCLKLWKRQNGFEDAQPSCSV